jgi:hypothetical protein
MQRRPPLPPAPGLPALHRGMPPRVILRVRGPPGRRCTCTSTASPPRTWRSHRRRAEPAA